MMTEAEAKTRWCPFVQFHGTASIPNRSENVPDVTRCIGSACMAWRERKGFFHLGRKQFLERGDTYSDSDPIEYRVTGEGFCGLAGKP